MDTQKGYFVKLIPLTQGKFAQVSDCRYEYLMQWKWKYNSGGRDDGTGYAVRYENGKCIFMHNFINGTPEDVTCDHEDRNSLNNQDENLRDCTVSQNAMNRKARKDNNSGYKGVRTCKNRKKPYRATINIGQKEVGLGYFASPDEAAKAYDTAAKNYFGEFARTNF